MTIHPAFQADFDSLGLSSPAAFFDDRRIRVWRDLPERQNATLDYTSTAGRPIRLHIKRDKRRSRSRSIDEAAGLQRLARAEIPCPTLVAAGELPDRRSVVVTLDLAGCVAADVAIRNGLPFSAILEPTATLAAKLHAAGLHHRDLYLPHFFVNPDSPAEVFLIDAARVRPLPRILRRRWVVKDLAQFLYSTITHVETITDDQRDAWLAVYESKIGGRIDSIRNAIDSKVAAIARHDRALRRKQPTRNVSIDH